MREVEKGAYKRIPLEILIEVAKFCDNNGLKYFLGYGTLLGAIRHKGYIPWDDDIDIFMPRADYQKFREIFVSKNYALVDLMNDSHYSIGVAKIYDKSTFYYFKGIKRDIGLFIDVFVIDNVPEDKKERIQWLRFLKFLLFYNSTRNSSFNDLWLMYKNWKQRIMFCLFKLIPLPSKPVHKIIDKLLRRYEHVECKYVGSPIDTRDIIYNKSIFENTIDVEFENHMFKSVADYHSLLSKLYGDYMSLPPECDRVPKHELVAYYK